MIDLKTFENVGSEEFLEMIEGLTEKEQAVLMVLRGEDGTEPRTHEEAGRELGIPAEEVRQIETRALETMERLYSGWRQGKFVLIHKDGTREDF